MLAMLGMQIMYLKKFKLKHLKEYRDLYVKSDYYLQMYLKILEANVFKYMNSIQLIF